ncbi:MAG: hypothetical protein ABI614_06145 [Planctomycetota bacterium]
MAPPLNNDDDLLQQVTRTYLAVVHVWQGCDATTALGPRDMNLAGLKANQTRLLAEATSGEESRAWAEATRWLERLEQDIRDARSAASSAVDQFAKHEWAGAWERINEACTLEARYHCELVWGPLRDLLAARTCSDCKNEATV